MFMTVIYRMTHNLVSQDVFDFLATMGPNLH